MKSLNQYIQENYQINESKVNLDKLKVFDPLLYGPKNVELISKSDKVISVDKQMKISIVGSVIWAGYDVLPASLQNIKIDLISKSVKQRPSTYQSIILYKDNKTGDIVLDVHPEYLEKNDFPARFVIDNLDEDVIQLLKNKRL